MLHEYCFVLLLVTYASAKNANVTDISASSPERLTQDVILSLNNSEIVDIYSAIIHESKDGLRKNLERFPKVYNWAFDFGTLIKLTKLRRDILSPIHIPLKFIVKYLSRAFVIKSEELDDSRVIYNMTVRNKCHRLMITFVQAIIHMDERRIQEFRKEFTDYDIFDEIKTLRQAFHRMQNKEKVKAADAVLFYAYHLAAFEMIRSGMAMAENDATEENIILEYLKEIANITISLISGFKM